MPEFHQNQLPPLISMVKLSIYNKYWYGTQGWMQNLAFAEELEKKANELYPGLLRDIGWLKIDIIKISIQIQLF